VGEVAITKAFAATRLLNAAILMFFRGDDELATHLTASACSRLLSDMYERAGKDLHLEGVARGIHQLGLDFIAGRLPDFAASDPFLRDLAEKVAAGIQDGTVSDPDDLNLTMNTSTRKELMRRKNKAYNFLKHADIDVASVLADSEIDNTSTITGALALYSKIFPKQLTSQMEAFVFFHVWQSDGDHFPQGMEDVLAKIEGLAERDVRAMLAAFCEEQNRA